MDDPAEFGAIFDSYAPAMFRFAAHRLGRQAAEDVLAETFTRAFAARGRAYTVDGSLPACLYKIASNLIADELRRRERASVAQERLRARAGDGQFAAHAGVAAIDPELVTALEGLRDEERERCCCRPGVSCPAPRSPSSPETRSADAKPATRVIERTIEQIKNPRPRRSGSSRRL